MLKNKKMLVSSGFSPPKKDNYFVAIAITPYNLVDPAVKYNRSTPRDAILFGVTRPTAGDSSANDQLLYGHIPNLEFMEYIDMEWMHHYFGNRIHNVYPSAIYPGAPLTHEVNLMACGNPVLQWLSEDLINGSYAVPKDESKMIMDKILPIHRHFALKDMHISRLNMTEHYYFMSIHGVIQGYTGLGSKAKLILDNRAQFAHDRVQLVISGLSYGKNLAPEFVFPNGTVLRFDTEDQNPLSRRRSTRQKLP